MMDEQNKRQLFLIHRKTPDFHRDPSTATLLNHRWITLPLRDRLQTE